MPRPSFLYRAYDLVVSSTVPLPGLAPPVGTPLAEVRIDEVGKRCVDDLDGAASARTADAQRVRLVWPGIGRALVEHGRTIAVRRDDAANESLLGACLAGSALAIALFQRGHLVFHASAVSLDGPVVAFAGPSGAGKSTLAAACVASGAALVSDDVVCLEQTVPVPLVRPAYPAMRLADSSARVLHAGAPRLGRLGEGDFVKDVVGLEGRFETELKPLRALFLLEDAEDVAVVPRPPHQAAIDLVFNSYVATLLTGRTEADHFVRCADLATRIAVLTLRRPRRLDRLGDAVRAVSAALDREHDPA